MLALVDMDLLLYRVGYTTMADPEWVAAARCDEMMDNILVKTGATEWRGFLSDSRDNNFRTQLFPFYKANRKQEKPTHYEFLKEHLLTRWGAEIAHGMEADDALGIAQDSDSPIDRSHPYQTVVCSIDKDLLQVPGLHYNFVKDEWFEIDEREGTRRFYTQLLTGDTTDNIRGCRGIGPVKAEKALAGLVDEEDYLDAVFNIYQKQEEEMSTEEVIQHIYTAGQLLYILRTETDRWVFPRSKQIAEAFA